MWGKLVNLIPGVLSIPMFIGALLYAIFIPDTLYYALGIYIDLWFPILKEFWGYIIVFFLLAIPGVSAILLILLTFQSFHVLIKYIFGMYDPSIHGFITMYPAVSVLLVLLFSIFVKD